MQILAFRVVWIQFQLIPGIILSQKRGPFRAPFSVKTQGNPLVFALPGIPEGLILGGISGVVLGSIPDPFWPHVSPRSGWAAGPLDSINSSQGEESRFTVINLSN